MLRRTPLKSKTPLKRTAMKRKPARDRPKAAEKDYHTKVRDLPCMIGDKECSGHTTVSHRPGAGMGLKSSHYSVAALCVAHHLRGPNSIEGMGIKAWVVKYGPHQLYEEKTREAIHGQG